jgi:hypothetical protein
MTLAMTPETRTQYRRAYNTMTQHGINPGTPDANNFADWFWAEEQTNTFDVGCCDFTDRPAMTYIVTALRHLCGVERHAAIKLLELALTDLKER